MPDEATEVSPVIVQTVTSPRSDSLRASRETVLPDLVEHLRDFVAFEGMLDDAEQAGQIASLVLDAIAQNDDANEQNRVRRDMETEIEKNRAKLAEAEAVAEVERTRDKSRDENVIKEKKD